MKRVSGRRNKSVQTIWSVVVVNAAMPPRCVSPVACVAISTGAENAAMTAAPGQHTAVILAPLASMMVRVPTAFVSLVSGAAPILVMARFPNDNFVLTMVWPG